MITFVTIPKPFEGQADIAQRNAIGSWLRLPHARVLLLGDDAGVGEAAAELGAEHVPAVARNDHGTPLLDDAFTIASSEAGASLACFVNADILLPPAFGAAAERVRSRAARFLMVGECWNVRIETLLEPGAIDWGGLRSRGRKRGPDALDYFLFTPGVFDDIPPFAIGRTAWDNWLVWRARTSGAVVVDATSVVAAIHQDHGYRHVGSLPKVRVGPEATENRRLTGGGRERLYSRYDATHRLLPSGLVPNPLGVAHGGETARRAWAKLGYSLGVRKA